MRERCYQPAPRPCPAQEQRKQGCDCTTPDWKAGALRLVDICAHKSDADLEVRLDRGYDENGYPLCPFGYVLRSNGHDYRRRRAKWRCAKRCLTDPERPVPECDCLKPGTTCLLGRAFLAQEDRVEALKQFQRSPVFGGGAWLRRWSLDFPFRLSGLEAAYDDPEAFRAFCRRFREEHPEVGDLSFTRWFTQWFLESAEPRGDFGEGGEDFRNLKPILSGAEGSKSKIESG